MNRGRTERKGGRYRREVGKGIVEKGNGGRFKSGLREKSLVDERGRGEREHL